MCDGEPDCEDGSDEEEGCQMEFTRPTDLVEPGLLILSGYFFR